MKTIKTILLGIVCLLLAALPVAAGSAGATDTFTHRTGSGADKAVTMRPVYEVAATVDLRSLGLDSIVGAFRDIACDADGNAYLLTDGSAVIAFDRNGKLLRRYTFTDASGAAADYSGAEGIWVCSAKEFYIADTQHARVLHIVDDIVVKEYPLPQSDLIPDDFTFQPSKVAVDSKGYLYVVSKGSYNGALLYAPDGSFAGFYGANTVKGTVLTTLSYIWEKLTQNDEKRANAKKTLPYDFSDITVDENDFVYTCTGTNSDGNVGQLRILSPGGTNILDGSDSRNYGESVTVRRLNIIEEQNFCSVQADERGFIYALDKTFGLIYIYDTNSTLLAAFGGGRGLGEQAGTYRSPVALALADDALYVADSVTGTVTVYGRTAFGDLLLQAQTLTLAGDHAAARPLWEQVRQQDALSRPALDGLARAAYAAGEYDEAQALAREGENAEIYSMALTEKQSAFITANFLWIFPLVAVLIAGIAVLIIFSLKRQIVWIRQPKLRTMLGCVTHPFAGFQKIKYAGMGSLPLAIGATVLLYLTGVVSTVYSDFRYTTFDAATYNALFELGKTAGMIVLWTVANWAVSTLLQGIGRLREVFIVTAYSTLPLIVYDLLAVVLSHTMASANSSVLTGLHTIAIILCGVMLCVGLMTVHDFTFPRVVLTALLTVIMMILIVFVLFMLGILLSQFFGFVSTIALEAIRRF